MKYTPFCTPVDVILNGEYKGCYQLSDQVQVHKNRVNVIEMTPEYNSGDLITGSYLFEIDGYAKEEISWFESYGGNLVTIKSPSDDEITPEQADYIENYFNLMEANKKEYLDMNTFLRHFIVGELSGNTDTYWDTFMYKQRNNDTINTGPVWNFENPTVWGSYSAEVQNVSCFIRERFKWMDNKLEYPGDILLGNANGDGIVSIIDVTTITDYLLGTFNEIHTEADYNQDGEISIIDLTLIIDFLLCN